MADFKNYDPRNVRDEYKGIPTEEIRQALIKRAPTAAILMGQIEGDFNFANVIRTANSFGIVNIFYFGKKNYDRRAAVGTQHYVNIKFISASDISDLKEHYVFVGLENNISSTSPIHEFKWPRNALICLGEENIGIPSIVKDLLDYIVEIPSKGSVRSLNVASAAAIAMYDYCQKYSLLGLS